MSEEEKNISTKSESPEELTEREIAKFKAYLNSPEGRAKILAIFDKNFVKISERIKKLIPSLNEEY